MSPALQPALAPASDTLWAGLECRFLVVAVRYCLSRSMSKPSAGATPGSSTPDKRTGGGGGAARTAATAAAPPTAAASDASDGASDGGAASGATGFLAGTMVSGPMAVALEVVHLRVEDLATLSTCQRRQHNVVSMTLACSSSPLWLQGPYQKQQHAPISRSLPAACTARCTRLLTSRSSPEEFIPCLPPQGRCEATVRIRLSKSTERMHALSLSVTDVLVPEPPALNRLTTNDDV
jgi:hypothetical protein